VSCCAWPCSPATTCRITPSIARRSGSLSGGGFGRRPFGPRPPGSRFFLAIGHALEAVRPPCGHCSRTLGGRVGQVPPGHPSPPACPRQPGRSGMSGRIRLTQRTVRRGPQPAGSWVRPFTTQG
jgi:hypothetical protein